METKNFEFSYIGRMKISTLNFKGCNISFQIARTTKKFSNEIRYIKLTL